MIAKLKSNIKTSEAEGKISGKKIEIERELTVNDILDTNFNNMSIAMCNFIIRRVDFLKEENGDKKVYYGHVGYLGYFVAEDEIEKWLDMEEKYDKINKKNVL